MDSKIIKFAVGGSKSAIKVLKLRTSKITVHLKNSIVFAA